MTRQRKTESIVEKKIRFAEEAKENFLKPRVELLILGLTSSM